MLLEQALREYIKECVEKSDVYAQKAQLRAASGDSAIAQSFGDWAFIYNVVAFRLRQILRKCEKWEDIKDGLEKSES